MEVIMSFSAESKPAPAPKTLLASLVASVFLVPILVGFLGPMGAYGRNQLPAASLPPKEASVIGHLRSIMTAERFYSKRLYHSGYSPTFASLGLPPKGTKPSASHAGLLDIGPTSGKAGGYIFAPGYIFTYTPGPKDLSGKIAKWSVTARPVTWKKGVRSFFADQTGVIRWTAKNRAARATDRPVE
jgi:hypothetical protein